MTADDRPIEDRLATALGLADAAADGDAGAPTPDRADLDRRIARATGRHRRVVAVAAAVILVAAVSGGWAIGRAGQDGAGNGTRSASAPVAGGDPTDATDGLTVAEQDELPLVGGPSDEAREQAADQSTYAPAAEEASLNASGRSVVGDGLVDEPTGRLFQRELADGTSFDVRANRYADGTGYEDRPWWEAPAWCFPSGALYVGVRGPASVGQVRSVRYDEIRTATLTVATGVVGVAEREPRWVVVSQVPSTATRVTATFPDGRTDGVEPVGGVAVLSARVAKGFDLDTVSGAPVALTELADAADVAKADRADRLRIVARSDGGEVASYDAGWLGTGGFLVGPDGVSPRIPYAEPACTAPADLPAPGPEQPADPAAARSSVELAWATAFAIEGDLDAAAAATDDPRGVDAARAQVLATYPGDAVTDGRVSIDELVFADAETAYVRYTVAVPSRAYVATDRFGEARRVGGTWKVTRATVCDVLALGGGSCPPLP